MTDRLYTRARDGNQGSQITEFDLESVTWEWLSEGNMSFTIDPMHPAANTIQLRRRDIEVHLVTDSGDEWWGIPVRAQGDINAISFECVGLMNYFRRRYIDHSSIVYTSLEQKQIVANLVLLAQTEEHLEHRYLNIWPRQLLPGLNEKVRSREYPREEHSCLYDLIQEFATVDPPLGWRITWERLGTTPETWIRYFDIFPVFDDVYPLAFDLRYVQGQPNNNIHGFTWSEDSENLANNIYVTGGSAGNIRFEAHVTGGESVFMHGDNTAIISEGSMMDPDWLHDFGLKALKQRREPYATVELETAIVPKHIGLVLEEGQVWPIKIDCGRIQVDQLFRIIRKRWDRTGVYVLELEATLPLPTLY